MNFAKNNIASGFILAAIVLGVGAISVAISGQVERTVSEAMIMLVMVTGLGIYVGNSGVFSFGHAGFVMIGAYAQAWQTCCPMLKKITLSGLPDVLLNNTYPSGAALLASGLLAAAAGLASGVILLRLSGLAAAIATFAFLSVLSIVYSNLDRITAGTGSIIGIPPNLPDFSYSGIAALCVLGAFFFKESRWGLMLRASREDYFAAKAAGVRVYSLRLVAFVLSAFVSGIAGGMLAHFVGVLSVSAFFITMTMSVIAMMVIGGVGSVTGAVVGVAAISLINNLLRSVERGLTIGGIEISIPTGSQQVAVGLLLLLILVFRPRGLTGGKEIGEILMSRKSATRKVKERNP